MFGPLSFPEDSFNKKEQSPPFEEEIIQCILCPDYCPSHNELLTHIFVTHKMVIADVPLIADLKLYLDYWRVKFTEINIPHVCTTIQMSGEEYYLLSDVLPEDKLLREGLHIKRLERALSQQEIERSDTSYSTTCMFCRHLVTPTRATYIKHLADHHNIQLGAPENLVYIDKLLSVVQRQIDNLKCLFCERTYKSRDVLKEHMRKKGHKRLNPHNEMYDQFYIVNYREIRKTWKRNTRSSNISGSENVSGSEEDSGDSDWSDWIDECCCNIVCLFCELGAPSWNKILDHMKKEHEFDFLQNVKHMDFYHQVKVVNYIRREIYWNTCPICSVKFNLKNELIVHMKHESHIKIPEEKLWNCPEYFFPTYENDSFLCQLDDQTEDIENIKPSLPSESEQSTNQFDNTLFEKLQIT